MQNINQNKNNKTNIHTSKTKFDFQDFPFSTSNNMGTIESVCSGTDGKHFTGRVEIKSTPWILWNFPKYNRQDDGLVIEDTNVEKFLPLAVKSRCIDCLIKDILESKKYTPENLFVIENPYLVSPLTAIVIFYTEEECKVRTTVKGIDGGNDIVRETDAGRYHYVPVFGLYPEEKNLVRLELMDTSDSISIRIEFFINGVSLPGQLKNMIVPDTKRKLSMNMIFVYGGNVTYPFVFEPSGRIRYLLLKSPNNYGIFPISGDRFLFAEKQILAPSFSNPHSVEVLEMDWMGRIYHMYHFEYGIHHDACEMEPGGNLLMIGNTMENSVEDVLLEVDRNTGQIVKMVKMKDLFDKTYQDNEDWAHINTVSYYKETGLVLACLRNLHSVICLDWEKGKIRWVFGHPKFWHNTNIEPYLLKSTGFNKGNDDGWFYQSHAAYFIELYQQQEQQCFKMIMYDNHQCRRRTVPYFDNVEKTFVRIYEINDYERTVTLADSFETERCIIRSNAVYLPEQHRIFAMNGHLEQPENGYYGSIQEYNMENHELTAMYKIKTTFYRAYPFNFPLNYNFEMLYDKFYRGGVTGLTEERKINVSKAIQIPSLRPGYDYHKIYLLAKRDEKAAKRMSTTGQDLALMQMRISGQFLYIHTIDHIIKKVLFVGKRYYFSKDFSYSIQKNFDKFGRLPYAIVISIAALKKDYYKIYIVTNDNKMYDSQRHIAVGMPAV